MTGRRLSLTRRTLLGLLAAGVAASPALAAEHPSLAQMRLIAKDLLNAHRQGTVASFRRAIQRHAAVEEIADYSLGQYKSKLAAGKRQLYYGGTATFMARYLADQSREFRIAKYELGDAEVDSNKEVLINSKVYLLSGQTYNVGWRLGWRGGRYKVIDVKVLGFSLIYMQRGLFTSFISKRNGDVTQLVAALTR